MSQTHHKTSRHATRKALVQSIYAFGFDDTLSANELFLYINDLITRESLESINQQFYLETIQGLLANIPAIDQTIERFLDRPVTSIDRVSYAIIRLATYEIKFTGLSIGIAINEATELGKDFGMQDSYKYINAILDKIGKAG